jgi:hypothetical protein
MAVVRAVDHGLTITLDHKKEDRRQPLPVRRWRTFLRERFFGQVIGRQSVHPPDIRQAGHDPADVGLQSVRVMP